MIAVDTNILVYGHREDSTWHQPAYTRLTHLAESRTPWAIPWPCIHEFLAIITHPKIYEPPTPLTTAIDQIEAWVESPSLVLLGEASGYWEKLRKSLKEGKVSGPRVHDARIAAICIHHGIQELWTVDRDFGRFPSLTVKNPLI